MFKTVKPENADKFLIGAAEELADKLDLNLIDKLPSFYGGVFKAIGENGYVTLKVSDRHVRKFAIDGGTEYFHPKTREVTMFLESYIMTELSGMEALPSYCDFVEDSPTRKAIVREFIEGKPMMEYIPGKRCASSNYQINSDVQMMLPDFTRYRNADQKPIREAVQAIHDLGFSRLNLSPTNVVVTDDHQAYLVSVVGPSVVSRGMALPGDFEHGVAMDKQAVNTLFKDYFGSGNSFDSRRGYAPLKLTAEAVGQTDFLNQIGMGRVHLDKLLRDVA